MKTLRVCLSSDLPGLLDRNPDYLYFLYDKLFLYSGQNMIDVNFVIAERIPDIDDQVPGMIYILNNLMPKQLELGDVNIIKFVLEFLKNYL